MTSPPIEEELRGALRDDLTRALQSVIRKNNGDVGPNTPVPGAGGPGGNDSGGASGNKHEGFFTRIARALGPDTADSIPVPLLILGGLAFLLMAAALVSFIARRVQAKRTAADPPPTM